MNWIKQDSIKVGLIVGIVSVALSALITTAVLFFCNLPFEGNLRFFVLSFVPSVIMIRYYTRTLQFIVTSRTLIIFLFLTLVPFTIFLIRTGELL